MFSYPYYARANEGSYIVMFLGDSFGVCTKSSQQAAPIGTIWDVWCEDDFTPLKEGEGLYVVQPKAGDFDLKGGE